MTAKTQSQRNASYRQRQREKIARYEGALREIAASERGAGIYDVLGNVHIARKALEPMPALHIEV